MKYDMNPSIAVGARPEKEDMLRTLAQHTLGVLTGYRPEAVAEAIQRNGRLTYALQQQGEASWWYKLDLWDHQGLSPTEFIEKALAPVLPFGRKGVSTHSQEDLRRRFGWTCAEARDMADLLTIAVAHLREVMPRPDFEIEDGEELRELWLRLADAAGGEA